MNRLRTTKLGLLTKLISSGATPLGGEKTYLSQGPVTFLRSQNVRMGQLDLADVAYISEEADHAIRRTRVEKGDVLLNITGASIGRVAPFDLNNIRANVNQHVCVIRPISSQLDSHYLAQFLATPQFQAEIDKLQSGGTRQALTFSKIADFDIPVPPLPEQKRIAAILDKADAIRRKRQQAIKLADDFLRATFLDMFGDPVTNSKGWHIRPLSEVVKKGRIVTYGIVQAGPPLQEGVPYIRTGDIQDGKINKSGLLKTSYEIAGRYKRSEVNKGDIVMSIRATVGTVAPLPDELDGANLTQGTARISPGSKTNREYLLWTLKARGIQNWIAEHVKGATFREITLAKLRELPVMVPPLEQQDKFQSIVFQTQKLSARINAAHDSSVEFFNSLSQRAFRGDL